MTLIVMWSIIMTCTNKLQFLLSYWNILTIGWIAVKFAKHTQCLPYFLLVLVITTCSALSSTFYKNLKLFAAHGNTNPPAFTVIWKVDWCVCASWGSHHSGSQCGTKLLGSRLDSHNAASETCLKIKFVGQHGFEGRNFCLFLQGVDDPY